jgi:hypothetical protein
MEIAGFGFDKGGGHLAHAVDTGHAGEALDCGLLRGSRSFLVLEKYIPLANNESAFTPNCSLSET